MKNQRQEYLLQIIAEETVETQEQLLERLQERGIRSTQATISRDIKELHLIKEPVGQGRYRYAVSAHRTKLNFADRLRTKMCIRDSAYPASLPMKWSDQLAVGTDT